MPLRQLTIEEMRDRLAKITYKEGWRLKLEDHFGKASIDITFTTMDAYGSGRDVRIGRRFGLPVVVHFDQFDSLVLRYIEMMERHETREWFRIDGEMVLDPHRGVPS